MAIDASVRLPPPLNTDIRNRIMDITRNICIREGAADPAAGMIGWEAFVRGIIKRERARRASEQRGIHMLWRQIKPIFSEEVA